MTEPFNILEHLEKLKYLIVEKTPPAPAAPPSPAPPPAAAPAPLSPGRGANTGAPSPAGASTGTPPAGTPALSPAAGAKPAASGAASTGTPAAAPEKLTSSYELDKIINAIRKDIDKNENYIENLLDIIIRNGLVKK